MAKVDKEDVNSSKQIFIFANNSWRFLADGDAREEPRSPYFSIAISLSGNTSNIPWSDEPRELKCMTL